MIVPPVIQLFPVHIVMCVEYMNKISKGHIGSLGERCSIFDFLFWKGVAIFKLSYNYTKIISLQNVMEKINDSITLFLFYILKLSCSNFCLCIIFSYINVYIELFGESHLRATVYKFT